MDMADSSKVFISGSCAQSMCNRAQSVCSKLCEHHYRVPCLKQMWKFVLTFSWVWPTAQGSWFWDLVPSFASTVTMFSALYSCENWHECSVGHGRQLEGLNLEILFEQCVQSCAKGAQWALLAPLPFFLDKSSWIYNSCFHGCWS